MKKMRTTLCKLGLLAGTSLFAGAILAVVPAAAQSAQPRQAQAYDIPSLPLGTALTKFAERSGVQIMFDPAAVRGKQSRPLSGRYNARAALDEMLRGSDLVVRTGSDGTIMVSPSGTAGRVGNGDDVSLPPAGSQTAEKAALSLEEDGSNSGDIVVTAQKREERLKDVPISIVALSSAELKERNITGLDELHFAVPGVSIESAGWQRRIQIRGIGNAQGLFSLVGVYVDEAPVTTTGVAQLDLNPYDLERIEVLRGPQGTLYGEGSVGGTLRFIARKPELDKLGLAADASLLFTEGGDPSQRLNATLNVPIVTDTLGIRIASSFANDGGWIDQPAVGHNDFNSQKRVDLRIKGLWRPSDAFELGTLVIIHRNKTAPNIGEDAQGNYTQAFGQTTTPSIDDDYNIYGATATYEFGSARLLATANYVDQDRNSRDFGYLSVSNPGAPINNLYFRPYEVINKVFNGELRLASSGTNKFQWTLGGMYRHAKLDLIQRLAFGLPGPPGSPLPALSNGDTHTLSKSWAVFGDASYKITDFLMLGVGLRYFEDDQQFGIATQQNRTFKSTSPRFYGQVKLSEDANIYASVARGFRSGGFNAFGRPSYGPENVWTYELGTKGRLFDGQLGFDLAGFYTDYKNYQIVGIIPLGFNVTSNGGDARIKGIEWQIEWRPAPGWTFSVDGNYLDAKFVDIRVGNPSFAKGDNLPLIPKFQLTTSLQKNFALGDDSGFVRIDYNVQGKMSTRNRSVGTLFFGESSVVHMVNANFGVRWNDHLSTNLFVKNILDDRGFTDPFVFINNAARTQPRTAGIQISTQF